jgi:hypothetical protein
MAKKTKKKQNPEEIFGSSYYDQVRANIAAAEARYGNPNEGRGPDPVNEPAPTPTAQPPGGGGGGGGTDSEVLRRLQALEDAARRDRETRQRNEIEAAKGLARQFGLDESIFDTITSLVQEGFEGLALTLQLRATPQYKQRFSGNELLRQRSPSTPQLSPEEYLLIERQYGNILTTYGSADIATRDNFAELIGNQVSANELQQRFELAINKVRNADPALRQQLVQAFPTIQETDIARALLLGKEGSEYLGRKVRTAEIGAEAVTFGLGTERAVGIEQLGVTREMARQGFGAISRQLPTLEKLGSIFREDTAELQQELEREQFQNVESRRRRRLVESEQALFGAEAGLGSSALRSQTRGQI